MRALSDNGVANTTPRVKTTSPKMQTLTNATNAVIHVFHLIESECRVNKMRRPKAPEEKHQSRAKCHEPRCRAVRRAGINIGNPDPRDNGRAVQRELVRPDSKEFTGPSGQPQMYQPAVNRSRLRKINAPKQHLAENKETQRIKASRPRDNALRRPFQSFGPPRLG